MSPSSKETSAIGALEPGPVEGWMRAEAPSSVPDSFSDDQKAAAHLLARALIDGDVDLMHWAHLDEENRNAAADGGAPDQGAVAVLGKAGSGKTHLLAWLVQELADLGVKQIVDGPQTTPRKSKKKKARRVTFAVVAPTNKAASVLRTRGVAASTIHRIMYSPVYDEDYEALAEWLAEPNAKTRPEGAAGATSDALDKALEVFGRTQSAPAALASIGLRGSDFITGWKRRDESISIGLVDEASMLDQRQLEDLRDVFDVVCLFGDPAQLAPVMGQGADREARMAFESLASRATVALERVHRQAEGNPIIDLAYLLQEDVDFRTFEREVEAAAARDDRVTLAPRVSADLMARAPTLVWRNATRVKMIGAFRAAYGLGLDALAPGEPLICDGIELPARLRDKRIDLEQAGLVKGAQAFWLGPGKRPGFARLYIADAPKPQISVAAIINIEQPDGGEPAILSAASQGAVFVHGAACTIHKAQGSQWPEVQVFAPDLFAAARSGRSEAGAPLWRRLAYVAITRAQERLIWVTRSALARPTTELSTSDLTRAGEV